jgi:iron-sulfur cluster assembly accessory protein
MLQDLELQVLNISPSASQAVQNILNERQLEGYALRVYVAGGGCCGVNFGMALDNNFTGNDTTFDANGVKVVVDNVSMEYLRGATVDFVNDPQRGAGFVVENPNNAKSHDHGDGGCACGGSCACNSAN